MYAYLTITRAVRYEGKTDGPWLGGQNIETTTA